MRPLFRPKKWPLGLALWLAAWAVVPSLSYLAGVGEAVREAMSFLEKKDAPIQRIALGADRAADLRWVEKGREFWLDGHLFDLKKMERHGDSLVLWARRDGREELLHKTFSGLFDKKESGPAPAARHFWKCWLDWPMGPPPGLLQPVAGVFLVEKKGASADFPFSGRAVVPIVPPPRAAV